MKRELGSHATITIKGGAHDGAVGIVLDSTDIGDRRFHLVRLPDGTVIEVATDLTGEDDMPRETGT